jgi:lysozyme family protein
MNKTLKYVAIIIAFLAISFVLLDRYTAANRKGENISTIDRGSIARITSVTLAIETYVNDKQTLPNNLVDLKEYLPGLDNEINAGVTYDKLEAPNGKFKVCAPYLGKNLPKMTRSNAVWVLDSGSVCLVTK